ncbi:MAG: DNA alkylation repair protein [Clostridia bacterium]|nr:DNA alkylation repair protein [Clostridia bacterium]MBR7174838.1 DNA alkylation repair protein [Clostridia bacterium]
MNRDEIAAELYSLQDRKYAALQATILPTVPPERIIGVRTPALRAMAARLARDEGKEAFLELLPHPTFDEDQLHAFVISLEKDFDPCIREVGRFLPYIDNWATCDQLSPRVFRKEPERLLPYIRTWIRSEHVYTVRFAVGMLMQHFLGERFRPEYADMVAAIRSDEYYINMMIAWYFATALAKQYDLILPYLEDRRLDAWTHNKAIQKSLESFRITPEQKAYLRTLKAGKKAGR